MRPRPTPPLHALRRIALASLALVACAPVGRAAWTTHGGNAQHTALGTVPSQPLQSIRWQAAVDLFPQYAGGEFLLIHYGTPLVTEGNTVIFPVKTGVNDGFRVEARAAVNGALRWMLDTDYQLPPHGWTPSVGPVITPQGRLYFPGAGGTLLWTDALDTPGPHNATRAAFFGNAFYATNAAAMNASLRICTPLTSADDGTIYFGVRAVIANPLGIQNGLASVDRNGVGRFVSILTASGGLAPFIGMNCAPALSSSGDLVYLSARGTTSSPGYLLALRTADLTTQAVRALVDPLSGQGSSVSDNGTSSPMVAPDGRVFFGVLGTPSGTNASRGWLLQFDSQLVPTGAPGAFGWDHTPSLVPPAAVPGYAGSSGYLLMSKYNFYASASGGDGVNKIAILDPDDTQTDSFSGVTVMKEIRVIAGVTPDTSLTGSYPNAVLEWCINTTAVDPFTHSALVGSEDGKLYRWHLGSNTFTESIVVAPELGQAYTPSLIGPDGQVYTIHNAVLSAVGAFNAGVPEPGAARVDALDAAWPNPSFGPVSLRFRLGESTDVALEVLDVAGRRVAVLRDGHENAGEHTALWDGRDAAGREAPPGLYLARLRVGGELFTTRLVRVR